MYMYMCVFATTFVLILPKDDGFPIAELKDNAIPPALINQLHNFRLTNGWTMADAVTFTRQKLAVSNLWTVPRRDF